MTPLKDIVLNFCLDRERNNFENRDNRKGQLIHVEPSFMKVKKKKILAEYFGVTLKFKKNRAICRLVWEENIKANLGIENFMIRLPNLDIPKEIPYDLVVQLDLKIIKPSDNPKDQVKKDPNFDVGNFKKGQLLDVSVKNPYVPASLLPRLNRICKFGIV